MTSRFAFKEWLLNRIARQGLSFAELARAVGVHGAAVSHWVKGRSLPSARNCVRLAEVFGEHPDTVLTLVGHRPGEVRWQRPGNLARELVHEFVWEMEARLPLAVPVLEQTAAAGPEGGGVVDYIYLPPAPGPSRRYRALRVLGDCMEPDIRPGDTVIFDPDGSPQVGDIVVAFLAEPDKVVVKRYREWGGRPGLDANNAEIPLAEGDRILGVVIQVSRWLR